MKKNMLAIVILATNFICLTLLAVLVFTIVPKAKRTDALIEKIVAAVELETESNIGKDYGVVAPEDQHEHVFQDEYVNLKPVGNEANVAMANIAITLNMKHEDYKTVQPLIESKKTKIMAAINGVLGDYTSTEIPLYTEDINADVLEKIREIFQSECIIEVTLQVTGGK